MVWYSHLFQNFTQFVAEGQSERQVGGIPGLLLVLHDQIPANLTHQGYREIIMYK